MKYLMLDTDGPTLRDEVIGYTCEDTMEALSHLHEPVGFMPDARGNYMYSTVLHALASGWRLVGQPIETPPVCDDKRPMATWWLTDDNRPTLPPQEIVRRTKN